VRIHPEPELVDQTLRGEGVRQLPASGDRSGWLCASP
jgi:hypothetical protein